MSTRQELIEEIAKNMADRIGHGMREKCMIHAEVALDLVIEQKKKTQRVGIGYSRLKRKPSHESKK